MSRCSEFEDFWRMDQPLMMLRACHKWLFVFYLGIPQSIPQHMSTARSEIARILSNRWNMEFRSRLNKKTRALVLVTIPRHIKKEIQIWVLIKMETGMVIDEIFEHIAWKKYHYQKVKGYYLSLTSICASRFVNLGLDHWGAFFRGCWQNPSLTSNFPLFGQKFSQVVSSSDNIVVKAKLYQAYFLSIFGNQKWIWWKLDRVA